MKRARTRLCEWALVLGLTSAMPTMGWAEEAPAASLAGNAVGPTEAQEVVVAELTEEERDRLEELERQIKQEEEEAYRKGVKKGRTTAALWGCGAGVVAVIGFYAIVIIGLLA